MKNYNAESLSKQVNDCTVSKLYAYLISNYLGSLNKSLSSEFRLYTHDCLSNFNYQERISLQDMETLIFETSQQLGGMSFGLDIGKNIHPSDYGVIGYALMNCANLHQALDFAAQHKHVMNDGLKVALECKGEYCHFRIKNLTSSQYINALIELDFASALQLSRFFVGSQTQNLVKFIQVNFQHAPLTEESKYHSLFKCPIKFGMNTNEIIISRSVLELPIRSANPRLLKMYLRKVDRMQQIRKEAVLTHQQVFSYVSNHIGIQLPTINQVASHFNMSLSSFKKKLQQEGYHYTAICDEVRKREALRLVSSSQKTLKEIGSRLGFANPSAFNRAFKRWTQMTPAEYRKSICEAF